MSEQGMAPERNSGVGPGGRWWFVRGRWTLLIGIAVVAALGVGSTMKLGLLDAGSEAGASGTGDAVAGDTAAGEGATTATPQQEFTSLTTKGANGTYHAVYRVVSQAGRVTDQTIEVWRSGGSERADFVRPGTRSAYFSVDGKASHCLQKSGAWTCNQNPIGTPGFKLAAANADEVLTATDGSWNGSATRCFTFKTSSATQQMCFLNSGVLVKAVLDTARIEATSEENEFPDAVFSLPAAPE